MSYNPTENKEAKSPNIISSLEHEVMRSCQINDDDNDVVFATLHDPVINAFGTLHFDRFESPDFCIAQCIPQSGSGTISKNLIRSESVPLELTDLNKNKCVELKTECFPTIIEAKGKFYHISSYQECYIFPNSYLRINSQSNCLITNVIKNILEYAGIFEHFWYQENKLQSQLDLYTYYHGSYFHIQFSLFKLLNSNDYILEINKMSGDSVIFAEIFAIFKAGLSGVSSSITENKLNLEELNKIMDTKDYDAVNTHVSEICRDIKQNPIYSGALAETLNFETNKEYLQHLSRDLIILFLTSISQNIRHFCLSKDKICFHLNNLITIAKLNNELITEEIMNPIHSSILDVNELGKIMYLNLMRYLPIKMKNVVNIHKLIISNNTKIACLAKRLM